MESTFFYPPLCLFHYLLAPLSTCALLLSPLFKFSVKVATPKRLVITQLASVITEHTTTLPRDDGSQALGFESRIVAAAGHQERGASKPPDL